MEAAIPAIFCNHIKYVAFDGSLLDYSHTCSHGFSKFGLQQIKALCWYS